MRRVALVAVAAAAALQSGSAAAPPRLPRIVFSADSGLYTIGADGSDLARVPGSIRADDVPAFFPDGKRLVFQDEAGDGTWIVTMRLDGSERRAIRRVHTAGGDPVVSPDGTRIAYDDLVGNAWGIWVMRADGSHAEVVSREGLTASFPVWLSDRTIVFDSAPDYGRNEQLYEVDVQTHEVTRLATAGLDAWHPAVSPDGRSIVFQSGDGRDTELYVLAGGTTTRLTSNRSADGDPSWTPDGSQILFDTGRTGFGEIYRMNPDGSKQRRVTRLPREAAWSPRSAPA